MTMQFDMGYTIEALWASWGLSFLWTGYRYSTVGSVTKVAVRIMVVLHDLRPFLLL